MTGEIVQHPFFSIGVTTYKRTDLLRQTISSLLNQEFRDFEVIIGNDCVEEPLTREMIGTTDDRILIVNNEYNLGELANMNSLLKLAKGRYFSWQFDDDLCSSAFLAETHRALTDYNFPTCVFSSFMYVYGSSSAEFKDKSGGANLYAGREFLRSYLSGRIRVLGSGGFIQTDFLRRIGGASQLSDGKMAVYSEYLLIFKAGLLNNVAYLNSKLIANRVHKNSFSCRSMDVLIYRQAGVNLVRESLLIFADPGICEDFARNMVSLFKSVISAVITKSRMAGLNIPRRELMEYVSEIRKEFFILKDPELRKDAEKSLEKTLRYIPLFRLKGWIRSILSIRYLKLAHSLSAQVSKYTNKSF